jgi:hypothetical protein
MFQNLPTLSLRLEQLFAPSYLFRIPGYQRPYSWTVKEAGQLLEDVLSASGVDGMAASEPDYFLGAMVLLDPATRDGAPQASREQRLVEIIDGQQRAVTLTILAAVLRDLAPDRSSPPASRLAVMISGATDDERAQAQPYRILLRGADGDFMRASVQQPGATREPLAVDDLMAGQRAIHEVRAHFLDELSELSDAEREALALYLLERCHVVVIMARDIDRGLRLFTVLNQRGKPLRRSDIIKAEVLAQVTQPESDEATALWELVERSLGDDLEEFFGHLRTLLAGSRSQIVAGIRSIVTDRGGAMPFLRGELVQYAVAYRRLLDVAAGRATISPACDRAILYLTRLSGTEWLPAALLALSVYSGDEAALAAHLVRIDRLAHALRLLTVGSPKRARRFAAVVAAIKRGEALDASCTAFDVTRDEQRKIRYGMKDLHGRSPQMCKLLLLRLSDVMEHRPTRPDLEDLTIEHVLPQRPPATSEWRRLIPDATEREACTQSIGNLVLVGRRQNDRARNRDFAAKQRIYLESGKPVPALTHAALQAGAWDAAHILDREHRLLLQLAEMLDLDLAPKMHRPPAGAPGTRASL